MPAVMIAVPPPPPMPTMPAISLRVSMKRAKGLRHRRHGGAAVVAAEHGAGAVGMMASDLGCRDVRHAMVGRRRADVDAQRLDAGGRRRASARKASSSPLVSAVPTT